MCGSKFLMQELLFSILVKVPRVDRLEYPDFQPAGDGGGLGELAVHGDRVRLVHQHLLVRVQVVKVETLWRMALLRTSGIFSSSFNLYILSQAKLPHFEVVPPAQYQRNIAKGTTDPRVKFISHDLTQILIRFQFQNLD